MRILLLTTTTGYQTRSFAESADRAGIRLVFATDRCHQLDDPWRDQAIPIRFHDEEASVRLVLDAAQSGPFNGILALGDRPTAIAARVAAALGLPGNPPGAAAVSRSKLLTRRVLTAAGLPQPWFRDASLVADPGHLLEETTFPCILKPLALSGSRGVMRADNAEEFVDRFHRLRRLLQRKDVREMRDPQNDRVLVEGFIEGAEFALEGLLDNGRMRTLAIFDKPDPLDGPFFEESLYITPSRQSAVKTAAIVDAATRAAAAIGLWHGPVHAEVRARNEVVVLEVAARPIGGLCARVLEFLAPDGSRLSLEELLLRHAAGQEVTRFQPAPEAAGVMMIPIPGGGVFRAVDGLAEAAAVDGISDLRVTAKPDQMLVPLPEGSSYLGFIFARGDTPDRVEGALRRAHGRLRFQIDPALVLME